MLLIFATFSPVLQHELLPWDDAGNITRNPFVHPPHGTGLARLWTAPYDGLYVPVVYTTYLVEVAATGGREAVLARVVHVTNLILHAAAALLVFEITRLLLKRRAAGGVLPPSWLAATVFALHPLQAEAVNWATGRKDLLAGVFALAALYQYLRWRQAGERWRWGMASALFLLALLSKPAAAALPLAAAALDWYVLRVSLLRSARALWPWAAAALAVALFTSRIQAGGGDIPEAHAPAWMRPVVAVDAMAFYLEKLVLPFKLSPVYGRPLSVVTSDTRLLLLALPLVLVPVGYLLTRRNLVGGGTAAAVCLLLPASGIVPFHYQAISTVADRYFYMSMMGVALAVAAGLHALTRHETRAGGRIAAVVGLGIFILPALAYLSFSQSRVWRSSHSLWHRALQVAPNSSVVHNNLGMLYSEQGKADLARAAFERAVVLHPPLAGAHNNFANLLSEDGQTEEARQHYEAALKINPLNTAARTNLAVLHFQAQRLEEAGREAKRVLQTDPDNLLALNVRTIYLGTNGRGKEAVAMLREAARRRPENRELQALLQQAEQLVAAELR